MIANDIVIEVNGIHCHACHGVFPWERMVGAMYTVDLALHMPQCSACATDNLQETVDYGAATQLVLQEMAIPSQLIEHVAARIAQRLLQELPTIGAVGIRVHKHCPPIEGAQVEEACFRATFTAITHPSPTPTTTP